MDTPITFFFFNKPETTKTVFAEIKKVKPRKIYLVSDGPRLHVAGEKECVDSLRQWIDNQIDWDTDVIRFFSKTNMGCRDRIVSGLNQVFEKEEYSIILEDDCLPNHSFFSFCDDMLKYYKYSTQVMMISGSNFASPSNKISDDYTFSSNVWIWGWATWRRAWQQYDVNIRTWPKLRDEHILEKCYVDKKRYRDYEKKFNLVYDGRYDIWDYQWVYAIWVNAGIAIIPKHNLVKNIGFSMQEATHTQGKIPKFIEEAYKNTKEFTRAIEHVNYIVVNREYDRRFDKMWIHERQSESLKRKILMLLNLAKKALK